MNTRNLLRNLLSACTTFVLTALPLPATSGTSWDLPLAWPSGNLHVENARTFAAQVKEATKGDVTINIHPGGGLGFKGPEMLAAVRDGLVPIGDIVLNQQVGVVPLFGLDAVPFLVTDQNELKVLYRFYRPIVDQVAAKYKQKVLYMVPWPALYLYTKKPAKTLNDFRGQKIRTINKSQADMMKRLGMVSVQLPFGDVVPALASGALDGIITSATSGVDISAWEFLKYLYPTNHAWTLNAVNVNLEAWNRLPVDQQKTIQRIATELEPKFWETSAKDDAISSKKLAEKGMLIEKLSPDMLVSFKNLTKPMLEDFLREAPEAEPIVVKFKQAIGK